MEHQKLAVARELGLLPFRGLTGSEKVRRRICRAIPHRQFGQARITVEADLVPVVRDRREVRVAVESIGNRGAVVRVDVGPLERVGAVVAHVDIRQLIVVTRNQIVGAGPEGDHAPVVRQRRLVAVVISLRAIQRDADPLDLGHGWNRIEHDPENRQPEA